MTLDIIKVNPTQNMTILVKSSVRREEHKSVANKLMAYESVFAEQVGFIEEPESKDARARLQMMGGEFCGNATMSLASYLVWEQNLKVGTIKNINLEVSGSDSLLNCRVEVREDCLKSKIKMPSAEKIEQIVIAFDGKMIHASKVTMPGIIHFIVDENYFDLQDHAKIDQLIGSLSEGENVDAIGIIFWNKPKNFITPLVYVLPTDSKIWERGCGSGSAALGALMASESAEDQVIVVKQPGGEITVYAQTNGEIWIEGIVKIVVIGKAYR